MQVCKNRLSKTSEISQVYACGVYASRAAKSERVLRIVIEHERSVGVGVGVDGSATVSKATDSTVRPDSGTKTDNVISYYYILVW